MAKRAPRQISERIASRPWHAFTFVAVLVLGGLAGAAGCEAKELSDQFKPKFGESQALDFAAAELCPNSPETIRPRLSARNDSGDWLFSLTDDSIQFRVLGLNSPTNLEPVGNSSATRWDSIKQEYC
jgi:hypothetical protein